MLCHQIQIQHKENNIERLLPRNYMAAQVWRLQLRVTVLEQGGNITDAAMLCYLGILRAFRRPEVTVETSGSGAQSVIVHPLSVREGLPLAIQQPPVAVTFALTPVQN